MVKIREILRLKSLGIGVRSTTKSCNCSRNTVRDVLKRAELEKVSWPLAGNMDDEKLLKLLYPTVSAPAHRKPYFADYNVNLIIRKDVFKK